MIEILDNDTPIEAARKIIYGTKPCENTIFAESISRILFRQGKVDQIMTDMFSLE